MQKLGFAGCFSGQYFHSEFRILNCFEMNILICHCKKKRLETYSNDINEFKQSTKKESVRRRMKQILNSTISTTSFITVSQSKSTSNRPKQLEHTKNRSLSNHQLHRNSSTGAHVDEKTKYPSHESRANHTSLDHEVK